MDECDRGGRGAGGESRDALRLREPWACPLPGDARQCARPRLRPRGRRAPAAAHRRAAGARQGGGPIAAVGPAGAGVVDRAHRRPAALLPRPRRGESGTHALAPRGGLAHLDRRVCGIGGRAGRAKAPPYVTGACASSRLTGAVRRPRPSDAGRSPRPATCAFDPRPEAVARTGWRILRMLVHAATARTPRGSSHRGIPGARLAARSQAPPISCAPSWCCAPTTS